MTSEKRKPKATREQIPSPVSILTEEQLRKLQRAAAQPCDGNLAGTSFGNVAQPSEAGDSGMSPFNSLSAELDGENAFAFYASGGNPPDADRSTLVDAVLEQLRQARMRRQRPH